MNAEKLKLLAPDLTKSYPRSPRETLAGYVIAARMLVGGRLEAPVAYHHHLGPEALDAQGGVPAAGLRRRTQGGVGERGCDQSSGDGKIAPGECR